MIEIQIKKTKASRHLLINKRYSLMQASCIGFIHKPLEIYYIKYLMYSIS